MRLPDAESLRQEISRWDSAGFCALFLAAMGRHAFALPWTWEFHQRFFTFFTVVFALAAALWLGLWRKFAPIPAPDSAGMKPAAHPLDWIFRGFWFAFFIAMVIAFNEGPG